MKRAVLLVCVAACGDNTHAAVDAAAPPRVDAAIDAVTPDANPLASLVGTGLCLDPRPAGRAHPT